LALQVLERLVSVNLLLALSIDRSNAFLLAVFVMKQKFVVTGGHT
jgi:hypothetical protein